LSDFVRGMQGK